MALVSFVPYLMSLLPWSVLFLLAKLYLPEASLRPASGAIARIATARGDVARTGVNASETQLTPSNVAAGDFGLLCRMPVDGHVYSQPLYIPNVVVSGSARDLVIVATMKKSVHAFDANGCAQLWKTNPGPPWRYPNYPHNGDGPLEYGHSLGASSAVADPLGGWVYAVTVNNSGAWTLRKLSLSSGTQSFSTTIGGQVFGTGDPVTGENAGSPLNADTVSGRNLLFNGPQEMQRTSLLLSADGSIVYIGLVVSRTFILITAGSSLTTQRISRKKPSGARRRTVPGAAFGMAAEG